MGWLEVYTTGEGSDGVKARPGWEGLFADDTEGRLVGGIGGGSGNT